MNQLSMLSFADYLILLISYVSTLVKMTDKVQEVWVKANKIQVFGNVTKYIAT